MFYLLVTNGKTIEVRCTETAPVIDGSIEEIWQNADSTYGFVQYMPYEKEKPSDETSVYLLQDNDNLYIAIRCWTRNIKPVKQLGGNEDFVVVYIDPFGSKTTAYYFEVHISNTYDDGWILDDGRTSDNTWDGVWYQAVKVFEDRYEVEIKIPFKSIRYKKGLSEWGINFKRYICAKQEQDYWTEVLQLEGHLVSKYGTLRGINPRAKGYYFEIYPEGFVRSHKTAGTTMGIEASYSLNLKWDITSQSTLNATALPDFAQIESDPFTLNLSRYETYLSERRPFFIEGSEIFRMSDFGEDKGFYSPLKIFYSRRIGKSINGDLVPIICGVKLTSKSKKLNFGMFGAYTDELINGDTIIEPNRGFGILRTNYKLLTTSDIGLLFGGTAVNGDTYNYVLGLDGVYRSSPNQLIMQTAISDRNKKKGWAVSSGYMGFIKSFLTLASAQVISDSLDVRDIGYVPWAGMKKYRFITGPYKMYQKGILGNLWIGAGGAVIQEPGDTNWSKIGLICINPNLRNNWGGNLELSGGEFYEANLEYFARSIDLSIWGNGANYAIWLGGNLNFSYNYKRDFLAYQASTWHGFYYSIISRLSLTLESYSWIEWDTLNTLLAFTPAAIPRIDFTITPLMTLGIFNEFVFSAPGINFGETEFLTNRFGFLFSYNFMPRSWLYIAINDYREQDETEKLQLQNRIGAIKVKYLLHF